MHLGFALSRYSLKGGFCLGRTLPTSSQRLLAIRLSTTTVFSFVLVKNQHNGPSSVVESLVQETRMEGYSRLYTAIER